MALIAVTEMLSAPGSGSAGFLRRTCLLPLCHQATKMRPTTFMVETPVERRLAAILAAHVAGYPRRASRINWLISRWYVVLLSAMVLALQSLTSPTWAQTLKDLKCTGKSDIPWADQIVGCSNAIASGTFAP